VPTYNRGDLLLMAIKRQMDEANCYSGPITQVWDHQSQRAWMGFCGIKGFKFSETPDMGIQEPDRKREMQFWLDFEEVLQQSEGADLKITSTVNKSLFALVKDHTPEIVSSDPENMTEARRIKEEESSVVVPEEIQELQDAESAEMEAAREKSVADALRIAQNVSTPKSDTPVVTNTHKPSIKPNKINIRS